jgi:bifunctional non-homologous end joining protein LigD
MRFVVHEHHATRLHYDFRLEIGGALASWAVPKGPSMNPAEKRLAVRVDDHPLDYGEFEGIIPEGSYGAGAVVIWDAGLFEPEGDPTSGLAKGRLSFTLEGERLRGGFALTLLKGRGKGNEWLLIKKRDDYARDGWKIETALTPARRKTLSERIPPCQIP